MTVPSGIGMDVAHPVFSSTMAVIRALKWWRDFGKRARIFPSNFEADGQKLSYDARSCRRWMTPFYF
jgi:hypothetical protein